jgi:superfamily II DNA/RNA helicase
MLSDLTFLTNESGRKLSDRLNDLLARSRRFDCLVGYFYVSGFDLIRQALEPCEKIRILIGLGTEREVYEGLQQGNGGPALNFQPHAETVKSFKRIVLDQLEQADETVDVESAIEQLVRWCQEGKVELRAYDRASIHAKVYIFTFDKSQINKGHVITGSSNLSARGLHENLEFNVELKDSRDYDFASEKFEELWHESVDVTREFVRTIGEESHLAQFSPYQLYLKFLYEYFHTELNQPRELDQEYQPDGFVRFQYQHDAVLTAKRIVEEFNGVFLADVVGLGKTYMAAMLARELEGRSLVIAPPALVDRNNPGAWPNVFNDFGVRGFHAESVGKLDQILKLDLRKFKNIFIDEAHRFRNEDNETYAKLHRICRRKRVILVTATPFNNRPNDLLSQLKLFQPSRRSTLPHLPNLDSFFAGLNKRLRPLDRVNDRETYIRVMRENAREVRERILKFLMVRRTRSEIISFYEMDLRRQNLKFPEVEAPQSEFYELSESENEIFTRTIERITKQITYARYRPLTYLPEETLDQNVTAAQFNLAGFMKVLLVKRLESSFEAFRRTLGRFIEAYDKFIRAYEGGYVYVSKKRTALIFELIEAGDLDTIEQLIESEEAERYDATVFKKEFVRDLKNDLTVLRDVREDWTRIHRDPKWEKLKSRIESDPTLHNSKVLLFSESKETGEYLCRRMADELNEQPLFFSGSSDKSVREEVINNFDARVRHPKDAHRILITTDTLAEGVSLHRSNVVINYDIPWNPTRMMQRVGRINRVDTTFDRIFTYNFFPSKEGNDEIGLRESAEAKIEAFIEMLGTDARLLTENEEIKSFNLFALMTSKETLTGEPVDEEESELKYLRVIRDIQDNQKDLFALINNLPRKARAARELSPYKNSLLTYFRLGQLDKFYLATTTAPEAEELDFLAAAKILDSNSLDKKRVGSEFFALLRKNQSELNKSLQADNEATHAAASNRETATKLLRRLHTVKFDDMKDFTDTEELFWQDVIQSLRDGAIAKKTITNTWRSVERVCDARGILESLKRNIPMNEILAEDGASVFPRELKLRQVILSEYLI